ncbi:MAG TPA: carboxypeptidase-like regulatory domain-containing protein [Thermoanaerobaculia bacterium]|nr:carboxypeptidase-like regulatory domain-containing protein [Thermoanaerobaculia bacterium]
MTFSRILKASLLVAAAPLFAAGNKERAALPTQNVTISGVVRDSSGAPVAGAIVRSGTFFSNHNGTAADGKYSITLPGGRPTLVTIEDFAFEPVTVTITPTKDAAIDFTITQSRPTVTVKLTNGETHVLDLGTSQFAYLITFSGYARSDNANFCKPDGSSISPAKTEFTKIVGPAMSVNFGTCCTRGPVMTLSIELKSGEKSQVYFNDSCIGNEVDFLGRERSTGLYNYFNFANISEIDFP